MSAERIINGIVIAAIWIVTLIAVSGGVRRRSRKSISDRRDDDG